MKLPRILPLVAIAIGGLIAVRAIGLAPGLFEGARAWAEEAAPGGEGAAAAPARPAPAVCALTPEQLAEQAGVSPAELRILQSLQTRRTELDARDADFAAMLPLMATAEQKLDQKLAALTAIRAEMQGLLGQVSEREQAEIDRLVAVYSAMRPREAARVFATLNDSVRLPVAAAMRPRALSAIMAQMEPAQARDLTEKLARRFQAQQAAARMAAAETAPVTEAPAAADSARPAAATTPPPAVTPPAGEAAAAPAPTARRPASPPARRPAARPANRPASSPAAPAAAEPEGPRPYASGGAAAAPARGSQPRQSVD